MKTLEDSVTAAAPVKAEFFPHGAIAFFVTMLGGFVLIWLGMYWLLVQRQLGT